MPSDDLLLITGATGLVGSHVAEEAAKRRWRSRALVRDGSDASLLESWGMEIVRGDLVGDDVARRAAEGVTHVVHCAAKVGDWGPIHEYRRVNVEALRRLIEAFETAGRPERFVHISSLGVYEARDHYGTDETEPPSSNGLDAYTRSKTEAEEVVLQHAQRGLPAVVLRPGFIYGPRDRTVLPRLLERLREQSVKFFGTGEQLMNNTFVGNLVDAVFLALEKPKVVGEIFNITDGRLVSKREFISTAAEMAGYEIPRQSIPMWLARCLATMMEGTYRVLRKKHAPLVNKARVKFLALNLDFSIEKAKRELGYEPRWTFREGMQQAIDWFRTQGVVQTK